MRKFELAIKKIKAALLLSFSFSISFAAPVFAELDESWSLYTPPIQKLDFAIKSFCEHSPKIQRRNGLFYLPNQEEPFSGESLCVYKKNGQYFSKGVIKRGLKDGEWITWHENGQQRSKDNYKDGEENGEHSLWFDNGQLHFTNYQGAGVPDVVWYKNGRKSFERTMPNNIQQHKETWWHENGRKSMEQNYLNGLLDGADTSWLDSGQIIREYNFKEGKKHGTISLWYENGQIQERGSYIMGKANGKWIVNHENGFKFIERNYVDGFESYDETVWWDKEGNLIE